MFILCSASVNGTAVSTLAASSFNSGIERVMTGAAGNYQAEFAAVMRLLANGSISTRKIDLLAAPVLGNGNLIFRTVANGGTGDAAYVSLTGTASYTLWVPRTITWQAGSPATLSLDVFFLSSNGIAAPVTVGTTAGDLTAETKVWSGDENLVSDLTVDFGYEISFPQDGKLYQQRCFVVSQRPMIRLTCYDETKITTANLNPGSISTLTATLAELANGGVRGTTKQYSVTGHYSVTSVAGAKPGTVQVQCAGTGGISIA